MDKYNFQLVHQHQSRRNVRRKSEGVRGVAALITGMLLLGMPQLALAVDCNNNGIDDTLELDRDGDTVINACDNCLEVSNINQEDTDGDGYGNICDADLNDDLIVNIIDKIMMRNLIGTNDPDADLNSDGTVNIIDKIIMRDMVGQPPGPGLPELGERVSANFTTGVSSFDEGAGTVMVQIDLGVITQGTLTYTIADLSPVDGVEVAGVAELGIDFNDVSVGTVAVDGRFVDIPIEIINDDILSEPAEFLRITIEPGLDYQVGPFSQHTLSIIDNDVVWVGSLDTRGVRTELTVELTDSSASGLQGALVSDGYGAFPAGRWTATVSRSADVFDASFTAVTIPATATRFNTEFSRNIILHAENIVDPAPNPDGQTVSAEFIRGLFTDALTAATPDKAYLNRNITGIFILTRAYPKDSGWEPPLEVTP